MSIASTTLLRYLRSPQTTVSQLDAQDWQKLIRQARSSNLLSRLAVIQNALSEQGDVPGKIQQVITNALTVGRSSSRSVRWEVGQVRGALAQAGIPCILLKGAAYELAGLDAANGRLFVDVDIMVPRPDLLRAEAQFLRHGWTSSHMNAYDQRYYRDWMHEIPPLQHRRRKTSLDVHHTILPPTAAPQPDVELMWRDARPVPGLPDVYVLCPEDMFLHSATHLFHDGDLKGGLRDLIDLDSLWRAYRVDPAFPRRLVERAGEMELARPLFYALRYLRRIMGTDIPEDAMALVIAQGAPPEPICWAMDRLVDRVFWPEYRRPGSAVSYIAKWLLYVRSHYLRMPIYLLLPHLTRKALSSEKE